MASEILENNIADNSEISAQTLNNIAIDLGKDDFAAFSDGETYAVDKLNLITAELAGAGIIPSVKNEMAVTVSNGKITVAEGVGIFSNGMKVRLETPVTLDFNGTEVYVFIKYDSFLNSLTINSSEEEENGDYILPLAKISADGTVTDMRCFSKGKCTPTTANFSESHSVSGTYTLTADEYQKVDSVPLSFGGYHGLIITTNSTSYEVRFGYYIQSENGDTYSYVSGRSNTYENTGCFIIETGSAGANKVYLKFGINGNRLDIYLKRESDYYPYSVTVGFNVKMF